MSCVGAVAAAASLHTALCSSSCHCLSLTLARGCLSCVSRHSPAALLSPFLIHTLSLTLPLSRLRPCSGNQAAYSFVVNLIIPGTPVLSLVAVFINEHHPDVLEGPGASSNSGTSGASGSGGNGSSSSGCGGPLGPAHGSLGAAAGASPGGGNGGGSDAGGGDDYVRPADTSDWQPFDCALHRFLRGSAATRTSMLKLIPHIAEGSWVIKQSVGSVPVIVGTKLQTVYYETDRYIEASVDVTSSSAAAYITGAREEGLRCAALRLLCASVQAQV